MPAAPRSTTPERPRIALLGLHLESNAFAPVTTEADFRAVCYLKGAAITAEAAKDAPAMPMEMAACIRTLNEALPGWEPVPVLLAAAEPGGPVERGFLRRTLAALEAGLVGAGPLDGVYVSAHGAMTAEDTLDPDGELLALVRAAVGSGVPVVATLDLHSNASQAMVDAADVLIGYRTNPHVDQRERGTEAAHALVELLGGLRTATAFVRLPLVPVQTSLLTAEGPYAELIEAGQRAMGPEILNVTVLGGFSYGDTPKQGLSVIVTARGDEAAARRLALELAGQAWENRRRFTRTLTPLDVAVRLAVTAGEAAPGTGSRPIILADVSDNPGGGGRSNTVELLEALVQAGARDVLLGNFHAPALAAEAHRRGEGAAFEAALNAEEANPLSRRITLPVRVRALAEGPVVGTRGIYAGRSVSLGPSAALEAGRVTFVVTSQRKQCADPVFFTRFGLDPAAAATLVLKSRGHFRAGFDHLVPPERIHEVDAPGLTTQNLLQLAYRNRPRPAFPFEPEARWEPPAWAADIVRAHR